MPRQHSSHTPSSASPEPRPEPIPDALSSDTVTAPDAPMPYGASVSVSGKRGEYLFRGYARDPKTGGHNTKRALVIAAADAEKGVVEEVDADDLKVRPLKTLEETAAEEK